MTSWPSRLHRALLRVAVTLAPRSLARRWSSDCSASDRSRNRKTLSVPRALGERLDQMNTLLGNELCGTVRVSAPLLPET